MKIKEATETLKKLEEQASEIEENIKAIEKNLSDMMGTKVRYGYGNTIFVDPATPDMTRTQFTSSVDGKQYYHYTKSQDGSIFEHFEEVKS